MVVERLRKIQANLPIPSSMPLDPWLIKIAEKFARHAKGGFGLSTGKRVQPPPRLYFRWVESGTMIMAFVLYARFLLGHNSTISNKRDASDLILVYLQGLDLLPSLLPTATKHRLLWLVSIYVYIHIYSRAREDDASLRWAKGRVGDRVLASKRGLNLRRLVCSRSCCCDLGEIVRIRRTPWSLFHFPPSENRGAEGVVLVYLLISRNPPLRDAQTSPQFLSIMDQVASRKEWEDSLEFFLIVPLPYFLAEGAIRSISEMTNPW